MTKYYLVTVTTPYCGEIEYHTIAIPEGESIYDEKYADIIYDWMADNANEWWDEEASTMYEGDFSDYLGDCSWDCDEITEEEYMKYKEDF